MPGRRARGQLTLRNVSAEAINIDRVESSCPCLSVSSPPTSIEAGSEYPLSIAFDPSGEPDFRGRLSIALMGLGDHEIVLFEEKVDIEILPGPSSKQ